MAPCSMRASRKAMIRSSIRPDSWALLREDLPQK
jgi:hypothetical protein